MTSRPVTLFVPCLIDQLYPEIGFAVVQLLEYLGCEVQCKSDALCCGQPAFNSGKWLDAYHVAKNTVSVLSEGDSTGIVCPSGSCTAMVRNFYGALFAEDPAKSSSEKVSKQFRELSEFIVENGLVDKISGEFNGPVGYHVSCHTRRELETALHTEAVLGRIRGARLIGTQGSACCGFGGLFSVRFEHPACAIATSLLEPLVKEGVSILVSNDPGCIMHFREVIAEQQLAIRILHIAEFLCQALGLAPRKEVQQ